MIIKPSQLIAHSASIFSAAFAFAVALIFVAVAFFSVALAADDIDDLIDKRQENFKILGKNTKSMRRLVKRSEPDWQDLANRVMQMQTASSRIIGYFPQDGAITAENSGAKKAIWENYDDFIQLQQALDFRLADLADAISHKDTTSLQNAYKDLTGSCKNCHKKYHHEH